MWVVITTVYTKITATGIGKDFEKYDGVEISGIAGNEQLEALNGTKVIYGRDDDYIIIVGLLDTGATQTSGTIKVSRKPPEMDFVCESMNRLWGCKYGKVDGKQLNEIYCCKLGDFKNWQCYLGISTDSWTASVGSDGPWTGCINYSGTPTFFKEKSVHRVHISSGGAHQITEQKIRGVQEGSHKSLAVVNEVLFYKSPHDVCAYDGSVPATVGEQLGTHYFDEAVGGSHMGKYYLSMHDHDTNQWHMFVFDTLKKLWHREDNKQALFFSKSGQNLVFIDDRGAVTNVTYSAVIDEPVVKWSATTGLIGYTTVEQKYVSRINIRMQLPKGSKMDLYIMYDSSGLWEHCGHIKGTGTNTFMIPLRPRRCDHFAFKMKGEGDVRVYSFAKIFEAGSDVL